MTEEMQAAALGLIQGLTEYLPISSTAHLILLPRILDWPDQGLSMDAAANTGTLLAVLVYFRRDLSALLRGAFDGGTAVAARTAQEISQPRRFLAWLVVASTPLALVGFLAQGWIATGARSLVVIGISSLLFGLLLGAADRKAPAEGRVLDSLRWRDAWMIGLAQALALVPGTSRSGVVMTAGIFSGLDRETSARVAFLMAIPAGLLVALKDAIDIATGRVPPESVVALGVVLVVSAVSGYAVIAFLLAWLRRRSLMGFVVYRIALSAVLLALALS